MTNSPQCFPFPLLFLRPSTLFHLAQLVLHPSSYTSLLPFVTPRILLHLPHCLPLKPPASAPAPVPSAPPPYCHTSPHAGLDYAGQHRSVHTLENSSRHPIQRRDGGGGSSRRADATASGITVRCAAHSQHPQD
ncbi:hypothetical protein IWZ01DRAFT_478135 [Phyllosticta capitalensis]